MFRFYAIALLGAVVLSSCSVAARADVEEEFQQTVALNAGGEFDISNVNGSIEIAVWDRQEVDIRATKKANGEAALLEVQIIVEGGGDRVEVETKLPRGWNKGGSVSYRITLPASVDLEASTVNGRLDVAGVRGALKVDSVNGRIEISDAVGPVDAETVNGGVTVHYGGLPEDGEHDFDAVNGRIAVHLPADVEGTFHAGSVNGAIRTDFPLEVKKARFGPTRSLDGVIGDGGAASFDFQTVNGAISIRDSNNEKAEAERRE